MPLEGPNTGIGFITPQSALVDLCKILSITPAILIERPFALCVSGKIVSAVVSYKPKNGRLYYNSS